MAIDIDDDPQASTSGLDSLTFVLGNWQQSITNDVRNTKVSPKRKRRKSKRVLDEESVRELEVESMSIGWKPIHEDIPQSQHLPFTILQPDVLLCVPEEQEYDMDLSMMYDSLLSEVEPGRLRVEYCYGRVSRYSRRALRRMMVPEGVILELESIVEKTSGKIGNELTVKIGNPAHRLALHAICQYYAIKSVSSTVDGQRITTVRVPKSHCGRLPAVRFADIILK